MSELDDHIVVEFDTGRDCKAQYMQCIQCIPCKQIKQSDEFVSEHTKGIYNKSCRACLDVDKYSRLKGKE